MRGGAADTNAGHGIGSAPDGNAGKLTKRTLRHEDAKTRSGEKRREVGSFLLYPVLRRDEWVNQMQVDPTVL
jgi:hypothetical protein